MLSAGEVIEDGAVVILEGRVMEAGRWADLARPWGRKGQVEDLGEVLLFPGFINSHCHLDYTGFAGKLAPPESFTGWIQSIVRLKSETSFQAYGEAWRRGAEMLLRAGVTTVVDMESVPALTPEVWHGTPIRVLSCLEVLGYGESEEASGMVRAAVEEWKGRFAAVGGALNVFPGLAPHALYSTSSDVMLEAAGAARFNAWPLSLHVAESREEFEMFAEQRGPLHAWLGERRRIAREVPASPVRRADQLGALSPATWVAHANYLGPSDDELLALRGVTVVHCPRSHAYFRHDPFPLERLRNAGVRVVVGTDSLASVRIRAGECVNLNLLEELRVMRGGGPVGDPAELLRMVWERPAEVLGFMGRLGSLHRGSNADSAVIPFRGKPAEAAESLVHHRGDVFGTMVGGRWHWREEGAG